MEKNIYKIEEIETLIYLDESIRKSKKKADIFKNECIKELGKILENNGFGKEEVTSSNDKLSYEALTNQEEGNIYYLEDKIKIKITDSYERKNQEFEIFIEIKVLGIEQKHQFSIKVREEGKDNFVRKISDYYEAEKEVTKESQGEVIKKILSKKLSEVIRQIDKENS